MSAMSGIREDAIAGAGLHRGFDQVQNLRDWID